MFFVYAGMELIMLYGFRYTVTIVTIQIILLFLKLTNSQKYQQIHMFII